MGKKSDFSRTLKKAGEIFQQAKESLKILEVFEKEAVAKVRSFVKLPSAIDRKNLTNQRILASLQNIGVATQADLKVLEAKVERLEMALQSKAKAPSSQKAFVQSKSSELEN
jgi:polyhydroxyalkanoate synthesis regulator phasin